MASDKIQRLRQGTPPHKQITIRGEEFAVIIPSSDVLRLVEEQTEEYMTKNVGKVNDTTRTQMYDAILTYHILRDPRDLSVRIAESPAEIEEVFDLADIGVVTNAYGELLINKAPKIELLTQEELNVIKKHLETTPLNDLSTVLLVHLGSCHQTIVSEE